jgi:RiboL-PSP-HEPN
MNTALRQFELNLQSAAQLGLIYIAFVDKVTEAIRLDELLRAELVLAVSAVDCYVHDVVRTGMRQCFSAVAGEPNAYLNFSVSLGLAKRIAAETSASVRLTLMEEEIRRLHAFRTFQSAENISQALALIGVKSIWDKVGALLSTPSSDVRTHLDIIVDRRNRIAHESDIDPTMGIGIKYAIDHPMVQQATNFLERIVRAIHSTVISEVTF